MNNRRLLTNMLFTFWFGWFALAGIAITALINWITTAGIGTEDVLVTGSVIGIITGGVAAIGLFIINWQKEGPNFGEDRSPLNPFGKRFH